MILPGIDMNFIQSPQDLHRIAGLPAVLQCSPPTSVPPAEVTWYKDNALMVTRSGESLVVCFWCYFLKFLLWYTFESLTVDGLLICYFFVGTLWILFLLLISIMLYSWKHNSWWLSDFLLFCWNLVDFFCFN